MRKIIVMMFGCLITSFGLYLLKGSAIVTGGTAGLALSISYLLPISFSILFTLINIPFYILSYFKMGKKFTISTILAVSLVTLFSYLLSIILPPFALYPLLGSIIGGFIIGIGTIILFMNGSSLGGAQILSITLQKQFNWNMGKTNFIFDTIVILIGLYSVGLIRGLYSIVSVFIISFMMSTFKEKIANRNTSKTNFEKVTSVVETQSV
ncbi:membrane protein [Niallia circulans]|uniref:YitT family protein n=1 Tax=Niallia TaxID=2837506 RepID=UPI00077C81B7|nr:YitT family protein [Niallia circulans]MDR4314879.1 YitT family protein [Niallia circulans]MED3837807.1 YitT family protein [Niallia circulans]MED4243046.1 YitT family protein [Niallia circulans]MED4247025.1 YitT family protein [Niallia circulans]MED5102485.1 YitT family protein [Niallia circulans]